MASTPTTIATSLSEKHTSCYPSVCILIVICIGIMIVSSFFSNPSGLYSDRCKYIDYGLYDTFTNELHNTMHMNASGCTLENDMACRQWYLQNVLNVELFTDIPGSTSSQDCIIDSIFSLGKITLPIYTRGFTKIPSIATADVAVRTARHIVNSIDQIQRVMRNTFAQLEDIIDTSTNSFDPYIANCTTQITMSSILFELYKTLTSMFFLPLSYTTNPSQQSVMTLLYLMPVMMFLKTHISGLIESILMILSKDPTNKIDVSSINDGVFKKVLTNINNEVSMVMNTQLPENQTNGTASAEFKNYQSIMQEAIITVLSMCRSKIDNVQSLTTEDNNIRTIINGDLIHVFYKAFLYFYLVLKILSGSANVPEYNITHVHRFERIAFQVLSRTTPIPLFTSHPIAKQEISIDTPLQTYTSISSLRGALLDIISTMDTSTLNKLAKYSTPGNIGTVFMQILTSKSEILSMSQSSAQNFLYEYIKTLPESYLRSFLPVIKDTETVEKFQSSCGNNQSNKRFSIGKCINSYVRQSKQRAGNGNGYVPHYEMFGENYTVGSLQGTPTLPKDLMLDSHGNVITDSLGNYVSLGSNSYNTNGTYLLDYNRNIVLDSSNNPVLSADYIKAKNAVKTSGINVNASYIPALDSPYPALQSQLGKAAYDIRGIPDTPLSFAPISGLPGRPVT